MLFYAGLDSNRQLLDKNITGELFQFLICDVDIGLMYGGKVGAKQVSTSDSGCCSCRK